ncbi:helix-turn-helix domain-containing protein [Flavobacterium muglaense]|uniref:Helix-turn-helix transcriptional regulator n=1 Tax=Flavobacterium muglaense TaxID=2764716 RepID=A0A923MXA4_9FLAO|nr:helix-turn-helix transcriptional regulator [Flavobacterium muglaense]MBC5837496.1 helix-turn-helix transcriptional regulator [Flavobacterium muglaense]MBC5844023.1 helix-turn-helix transcriptional regulator [Flavobacterium muglaense]
MNHIAKKIFETRKSRGLSQEDLAELSKVNLRTIQRIENNENEPRGKTLNLVCNAIEIHIEDFQSQYSTLKVKKHESAINNIFLVVLNIILVCITNYLVLDTESNINSKIGAFLLSFFIPMFITYKTQNLSGTDRIIKFGSGYILDLLMAFIILGIPQAIATTLTPCLLLSVATL